MMGQTTHHYLIFETASGFCGIAWNGVGVTCLQLPTKSAEAAERAVRRRAPGAVPGAPTPAIAEAVAAVKRYFEGEETDFSGFKLDLDEQGAFFEQVNAAARRVGWGHTTTYGALAKELGAGTEAARDVGQAMARNPVPLIIPCHRVLAAGGKIGGSPRQAARPPSFACSSSRAFTSSGRDRYSRPKARRSSNGALQRDNQKPVRRCHMTDARNTQSDLEVLKQLNADFLASAQNGDVERLEEILAEDFMASLPDLLLRDKKQFLEMMSAPRPFTGLKGHDAKIRLLGDFAIIHARITYTTHDGVEHQGRYTDDYQRRDGKWVCVAANLIAEGL